MGERLSSGMLPHLPMAECGTCGHPSYLAALFPERPECYGCQMERRVERTPDIGRPNQEDHQ